MFLLVLFLVPLFSLNSQVLLKENTSFTWNSWNLKFTHPVVYKEEGGLNPKLTIYPAKQDDFFIVIRRLSFEIDSINEATFQKQVFTRPIDFQKSEVNLGGQSFTLFEADQIRNQNLLHNQVWVSKLGEPKIWVWVQWKKENALLGSQLGTGSFLSRSEE